jgi:hypothetical protein
MISPAPKLSPKQIFRFQVHEEATALSCITESECQSHPRSREHRPISAVRIGFKISKIQEEIPRPLGAAEIAATWLRAEKLFS